MSRIGKVIPKPIKTGLLWLVRQPQKIKVWIYQAAATGKIPFPDKLFQKWDYKIHTGRKLNMRHPVLFQEKLQWMKYYYHNPLYTTLVDKYGCREFIKKKIGQEYLVPLYGVYNSVDEINLDCFPNKFVLKCTHDSGSVVICRNKARFNFEKAKDTLETGLKRKQFYLSREWPYKDVKPRIICEKFLEDDKIENAPDYKFFCFDGKVKMFLINSERFSKNGVKTNFYLYPWERIDMKEANYENNPKEDMKPACFERMVELAEILSTNIPHVRVDFNLVNNHIYFGEMTFFHCGGRFLFHPYKYNEIMGDWIKLPQKMR